jgi:hypothetical protein
MALVKKIKLGRSDTACMSERSVSRRGVRGEGQVRESVETHRATVSRLCIMGTVLRTCERDTGRQPETFGEIKGRVLCGGIDRTCVSLHAYVT